MSERSSASLLACVALAAGSHTARAGGGHDLLALVADVPLPGAAVRLDYQEIDPAKGLLVIAHMRDDAVVIVDLADGKLRARLTGIPTPRGVAIADDVGLIFVTSTPNHLVLIDNSTLKEVARVETGAAPDGDAWDLDDQIVGVSDQRDGALSLIAKAGRGARTQVKLGSETGNVVYDAGRKQFWITVVRDDPPDQLVEVDPAHAKVTTSIPLPGCRGAHGLRLHPDGKSAFIACEDNDTLARVELDGKHEVATGATGKDPDVLSIDPGQGWLYVAAESGDVTIFDLAKDGVALVGHAHPGANAHTVVADPATHRVFFPLQKGPGGKPGVRIMKPAGP
jgi:DNA-binding beta-propeller fold protein YncE